MGLGEDFCIESMVVKLFTIADRYFQVFFINDKYKLTRCAIERAK